MPTIARLFVVGSTREYFERVIAAFGDWQVNATFTHVDAVEPLLNLLDSTAPTLILLRLPLEQIGTSIGRVLAVQPSARVIVLTESDSREVFLSGLRHGAVDVVSDIEFVALPLVIVRELANLEYNKGYGFQVFLRRLHDVTLVLSQIDQMDEFERQVVKLGRENFGFERLALFLYDKEQNLAIGTFGTDIAGDISDERQVRFDPTDRSGLFGRALDNVAEVVYEPDRALYTALAQTGFGWCMATALWDGHEVRGWLVADNALSHRPTTQTQLDILHLYGKAVATILAHNQARAALRENEVLLLQAMRQREESLALALSREKDLSNAKTQFMTTVSHEFRTPLSSILATADTLLAYRQRLTDDAITKRLEQIRQQVFWLTDIVDDSLTMSTLQTGTAGFEQVRGDMAALCRAVIDDLEHKSEYKGRVVFRSETNVFVLMDGWLMRSAVHHLIANGLKFSAADKLVHVDLIRNAKEVVLTVSDFGIGIPEVDMKRLFEPFHRAGNIGTIPGRGLGLSIAKAAVEMHGGTISAMRAEGSGTVFTVRLPAGK